MKSPISKFIRGLFLTQLAASVVTVLLFWAISSFFAEETAQIGFFIACIPGLFLMGGMLYSSAWHVGERDYNLVKHNHIKRSDKKGLISGLYAQIPGLILAVILVFYKGNTDGINGFDIAFRILFMPFVGLSDLFTKDAVLWRFVPMLTLPLFSWWGYYNGFRFISIWQNMVYSKRGKSRSEDKRFR